jgi:phosphatidylinositol glycan class T
LKKTINKRLKYSTLPSEIVCTENITPWIKLLPCGKYKGLVELLTNPSKLFDTSYNSIGIHFKHICLVSQKYTLSQFQF